MDKKKSHDDDIGYILIDPPVTPFSSEEEIIAWIAELGAPAAIRLSLKKQFELRCNAWWVTQKTLTHPTFGLTKRHSGQRAIPNFDPFLNGNNKK